MKRKSTYEKLAQIFITEERMKQKYFPASQSQNMKNKHNYSKIYIVKENHEVQLYTVPEPTSLTRLEGYNEKKINFEDPKTCTW